MTSSTCGTCGHPTISAVSQRQPVTLQPAVGWAGNGAVYVLRDDGTAVRTRYPEIGEETFREHEHPGRAAA